ncbi:hypothetical protein [Saccharospirillum sp.]|uniref:hypothetical protein n=1 Tax=Saccharospirillum sp. TaxID=2033801 RepID=UPI00349FFCF6
MKWTDILGLVTFKPGPSGADVTGLQEEITKLYPTIDSTYEDLGHDEPVITSGTDSHEDKPGSLHNDGLAIDIRGNDKDESDNKKLADELQSRLDTQYGDGDYDVIFEDKPEEYDMLDHIHIEYDPDVPPTMREDMNNVKGDAYGYCPA